MSPARDVSDEEMDAATWCRHLIPQGSVYASPADHRQQLFPPELFADLVVQGRSHPSVPTQVVATVMVLQDLVGLSDREAHQRVAARYRLEGRLRAAPGRWGFTHGAGVLAGAAAGLDGAAADL